MERIGERLRKVRRHWKLSLREVEERSLRCAEEWGDDSYHISASWLHRVERGEHELAVKKLIALAYIFSIPPEQLLRSMHPTDSLLMLTEQFSTPNATILLTEERLEEQTKYLLPDTFGTDQPPDETTLLPAENAPPAMPYKRGIIGKQDRILDPMVPAGSIVLVDTRERGISPRKDWKNEFQRPIYFLRTRDANVCGWCELDRKAEWLTLIPHHGSPISSQRFKYRTEIEILGRVVAVALRLLPGENPGKRGDIHDRKQSRGNGEDGPSFTKRAGAATARQPGSVSF